MEQPKISVITVCYNAENSIERTIRSVLDQTYPHVEYIIIDGASTDGTMDVVRRYKDRISVIVSEPDRGVYDAMNKGIKLASGEWVNLMNAGDTFVSNDTLQKVFAHPVPTGISFLYGNAWASDSRGHRIVWNTSFETRWLCHQAVIYRKSLHAEHGYYIVTDRVIISDSLFAMSIPASEVQKLDMFIANYEGGGLSAHGTWSFESSLCLSVLYRETSMGSMFLRYIGYRIARLVPDSLKYCIKKLLKPTK